MHTSGDTLGGKGMVYENSPKKATHAVIWMHGLGDTCDGWTSAMTDFKFAVPTRVILPTAPTRRITLNGGMPMPGWADVSGLSVEAKEDGEGFAKSFERIKAIIDTAVKSGIPASNIIIGGFSQGGALALHTAMRLTTPVAGFVGLSSWLPLAADYPAKMAAPAKAAKMLQVHGDADVVVNIKWGRASHQKLSTFMTDHPPLFETIQGMGHSSDPRELAMVCRFINALFKPPTIPTSVKDLKSGLKAARVSTVKCVTKSDLVKLYSANLHRIDPYKPPKPKSKFPIVGPESIMSKKDGKNTTVNPVQDPLRYGCDVVNADRICRRNRHYAEHSGYFETVPWVKAVADKGEVTYYDSVTGKPLFIAPKGRSFKAFLQESKAHGWPSFRDEEVVWENVRCLANGEAVSLDGTHLGHNLPDATGNRYCINLVSIAGSPQAAAAAPTESTFGELD